MSTLWIVCGAGRGVGKTRLAQRLCAALPNSVCAKLGHGKPSAEKPPNFFQTEKELETFLDGCRGRFDHIVLESNAHARRGEGDVIIYLEAIPGETDVREDAERLRANVHIRIGPGVSAGDWEAVLRERLKDGSLVERVGEVMAQQSQYLAKAGPSVRSKVWFVVKGRRAFGPGLARLLEGVERCGTLRGSADAAEMSYRYAWSLIEVAEKRLGRRLVLRRAGGPAGAGPSLRKRAGICCACSGA